MAGTTFLPRREWDLKIWAERLSASVSAEPARWGVPLEVVAELSAKVAEFVRAYAVSSDPRTRTQPAVADKNAARDEMVQVARQAVAYVYANPHVSNSDRLALGLTPRRESRERVTMPSARPFFKVEPLPGRRARVLLEDTESTGRRRPAGTAGAMIYLWVGEELPERADQWRLLMTATRRDTTIHFPDGVPGGARLWLTARWISTRLEQGPPSDPVSIRLPIDELVGQPGSLRPLQTTVGGALQRAA